MSDEAFDKSTYDKQYAKDNIVRKVIPFNRNNPRDQDLLKWVNEKPNATAYIKDLIETDFLREAKKAGK